MVRHLGVDRLTGVRLSGVQLAGVRLTARRSALLARAQGRGLEIGAGTGLNLGHYPMTAEEGDRSEPVPAMATRTQDRARGRDRVRVVRAPAESLPLDTSSVDTVVSTRALCAVPDPVAALTEVVRVLRPGGRLLFIEHVHAGHSTRLRRWQDRPVDTRTPRSRSCSSSAPTRCTGTSRTSAAGSPSAHARPPLPHGRLDRATSERSPWSRTGRPTDVVLHVPRRR